METLTNLFNDATVLVTAILAFCGAAGQLAAIIPPRLGGDLLREYVKYFAGNYKHSENKNDAR